MELKILWLQSRIGDLTKESRGNMFDPLRGDEEKDR